MGICPSICASVRARLKVRRSFETGFAEVGWQNCGPSAINLLSIELPVGNNDLDWMEGQPFVCAPMPLTTKGPTVGESAGESGRIGDPSVAHPIT